MSNYQQDPETTRDEIMQRVDELLSRQPRVQRERVIRILDTAYRIRLDAKRRVALG